MKKTNTLRLWPVLCAVLVLGACQKEVSKSGPGSQTSETSTTRGTGVVPDDPSKVSKIPTIVSKDFFTHREYRTAIEMAAASKSRPVKPGADVTPPTVSITSPSNGATVSGAITIQVAASDNVGVSTVSVTVDGALLGTRTASPYNFSWTADGNSHTITATAKDAAGNASSNTITVSQTTVTADNIAPTVSITSPANGSSISGTINVSVSATDNVGVSSVTLSVDGSVIGTASSSPYTFSWNTSNITDGTHTLSAQAVDAAGNSATNSILVSKNTTITTLPPTSLPSNFALTMPPVQNQGGEGTCVPFATTYAARSAEWFYSTNASSYSYGGNIFSPEFVYDQTKIGDCGSGTGLTTDLDFLVSTGVCTWQSMPYSSSNGCSIVPTSTQMAEAANYKIASYSKLVVSDVTAIKTMVVNKHPVIITVATDQSFWNAQAGFIWQAYSGTPGISHTIVICGYDDSKNAWKIMNSWGTTWGDAGFSWIDYGFLPQAAYYYGYVINA